MSGFLQRLSQRAAGQAPLAAPRVPTRYEALPEEQDAGLAAGIDVGPMMAEAAGDDMIDAAPAPSVAPATALPARSAAPAPPTPAAPQPPGPVAAPAALSEPVPPPPSPSLATASPMAGMTSAAAAPIAPQRRAQPAQNAATTGNAGQRAIPDTASALTAASSAEAGRVAAPSLRPEPSALSPTPSDAPRPDDSMARTPSAAGNPAASPARTPAPSLAPQPRPAMAPAASETAGNGPRKLSPLDQRQAVRLEAETQPRSPRADPPAQTAIPLARAKTPPAPPPVIEISIGTVEIRAAPPPQQPLAAPAPAGRTLDAYLAGERGR